jgi:hypothetical protein
MRGVKPGHGVARDVILRDRGGPEHPRPARRGRPPDGAGSRPAVLSPAVVAPVVPPNGGVAALEPRLLGRPADRTAATGPVRALLTAIPGPGGPGRSRPIAGGPIGPALDPDLVDSLLGSAMPGSLFDADGTLRQVRKGMRKLAASS